MAAANGREASAQVIVALMAAGRSRTTIKRHQAEYNAFARFLEGGGQAVPTEAVCLDLVAERPGSRLADLREPTSHRSAQLARRSMHLIIGATDEGLPPVR